MPSPSEPVGGARPLDEVWPRWQERVAGAPRLALFLDFDGTLVEIAPRPEQVKLRARVSRALRMLAKRPGVFVVVISGRPVEQLESLVSIPGVVRIGSHGYELPLPVELAPVAERARRHVDRGGREIERMLSEFSGAWFEPKPSGGTVHFRAADEASWPRIRQAIHEWHRAEPRRVQDLVLRPARAAVELRPRLEWGKGEATHWWLETLGPPAARGALVCAVGDDDTDEDLFRAWREDGLTIRVGDDPEATAAEALAASPQAIWDWLEEVERLRASH